MITCFPLCPNTFVAAGNFEMPLKTNRICFDILEETSFKGKPLKQPHFDMYHLSNQNEFYLIQHSVSPKNQTQIQYLTSSLGKIMPSYLPCLLLVAQNSFVATGLFLGSVLHLTFLAKEACSRSAPIKFPPQN